MLQRILITALLALLALPLFGLARAADDAAFNEGKRALEGAIRDRDAAKAREACAQLAKDQGERAAKVLIAAAPSARDLDFYDALLESLQSFADKKAVDAIVDAANESRDWTVRYMAVEALGGIEQEGCRKAVFAAFDDKHESVAACAMKICRARRWKSAVTPLIDRLERLEKKDPDSRLKVELTRALEGITAKSFSSGGDWRRWWAENEKTFTPPAEGAKGAGGDDGVITRVRERGEYDFIEKLEKGDVLVVKGASDQCEDVLDVLKIPYTLLERPDAKKKLATLDPRSVLVYNCEGDVEKGGVKGDDAKALAAFVEKGGYLFTSDWALEEELIPAFPGVLSLANYMEEDPEVRIGPAKGAEKHPLLRDVFPENPYAGTKMKWKIDNLAATFRCAPGKGADPIVESPDLVAKGGGSPTVAAYFRHGKGAVLHVLGHFHMQKDAAGGDGFALQQLLVNFIVEKQKFRAGKSGGKKK